MNKIEKYRFKLVNEPIDSPKFQIYLDKLNYHYNLYGGKKGSNHMPDLHGKTQLLSNCRASKEKKICEQSFQNVADYKSICVWGKPYIDPDINIKKSKIQDSCIPEECNVAGQRCE